MKKQRKMEEGKRKKNSRLALNQFGSGLVSEVKLGKFPTDETDDLEIPLTLVLLRISLRSISPLGEG